MQTKTFKCKKCNEEVEIEPITTKEREIGRVLEKNNQKKFIWSETGSGSTFIMHNALKQLLNYPKANMAKKLLKAQLCRGCLKLKEEKRKKEREAISLLEKHNKKSRKLIYL